MRTDVLSMRDLGVMKSALPCFELAMDPADTQRRTEGNALFHQIVSFFRTTIALPSPSNRKLGGFGSCRRHDFPYSFHDIGMSRGNVVLLP